MADKPNNGAPAPLDDVGPKSVISTSATPQVSQVFFYDETIPHIAQEHVEFQTFVPSLEHAVHDTVVNPSQVVQSNSEIHVGGFKFCSDRHMSGGNKQLVVAVKVVAGTSALLKTAYFTENVPGKNLLDES